MFLFYAKIDVQENCGLQSADELQSWTSRSPNVGHKDFLIAQTSRVSINNFSLSNVVFFRFRELNNFVILFLGVREDITKRIAPSGARCFFAWFRKRSMSSSPFLPPVVESLESFGSRLSSGR